MDFLDDGYLLQSAAAESLYEAIAELPILDPHTHADVAEIVEDDGWSDVWEVEAATDHYVWAALRRRGVSEELITGDASNREKWTALAEVFPELAGNPTYEWVHLDLKRRFDIETPISGETADEIWEETRARLAEDDMRPRALLREMNVEVLCSTDDPTASLEYHERAAEEVDGVEILPTWRADRAVNVDRPDFLAFVDALADETGIDTDDLDGYRAALAATHDRFAEHGCVASDLALLRAVTRPVSERRAREVYRKRLAGAVPDGRALDDLRSFLLEFVGELNVEKGWVTQLHVGALRDYRDELYDHLGEAAGGDVSTGNVAVAENLRYFVNRFDGETPIVIYCIDPTHYPDVVTVARAFPNVSVGAPWWFNDSPYGLEDQLDYVASVDLLANHAGMVSDSRKLLSYGSRFEMFRRCLANVVGGYVERGRVPMDVACDRVEHLAYGRPKELYGFE